MFFLDLCRNNLNKTLDSFSDRLDRLDNEIDIKIESLKNELDKLSEKVQSNIKIITLEVFERILKQTRIENKKKTRKIEDKIQIEKKKINSSHLGIFPYYKFIEVEPEDVSSHLLIAESCRKLGRYEESMLHIARALDIVNDLNDNTSKANTLMDISKIFSEFNDETKALVCKLDALEILKRLYTKDTVELAKCFNSIGTSYLILGDFEKAFDYLNEALDLLQRMDEEPKLLEAIEINIAKFKSELTEIPRSKIQKNENLA